MCAKTVPKSSPTTPTPKMCSQKVRPRKSTYNTASPLLSNPFSHSRWGCSIKNPECRGSIEFSHQGIHMPPPLELSKHQRVTRQGLVLSGSATVVVAVAGTRLLLFVVRAALVHMSRPTGQTIDENRKTYQTPPNSSSSPSHPQVPLSPHPVSYTHL